MKTINVKDLYGETAKLSDISLYEEEVKAMVFPGDDIILTGPGPVWLYLRLAHTLHGIATSLLYDSPVTGKVVIFNHNPH